MTDANDAAIALGEHVVRQQADVVGEHAEDQAVDEVGDRLGIVTTLSQRLGDGRERRRDALGERLPGLPWPQTFRVGERRGGTWFR